MGIPPPTGKCRLPIVLFLLAVETVAAAMPAAGQNKLGQDLNDISGQYRITRRIYVGPGKNFKTPYGSHLEPMLDRIGATTDQRKRIAFVVGSYRPRIDPLRQEYNQKSQEFIRYIVSGAPAEQIMSQQDELNNLYSVIVCQYSLMRLEIRRLLTPAQCRMFEEYRQAQGWRK